jgi:hypothetical protein
VQHFPRTIFAEEEFTAEDCTDAADDLIGDVFLIEVTHCASSQGAFGVE